MRGLGRRPCMLRSGRQWPCVLGRLRSDRFKVASGLLAPGWIFALGPQEPKNPKLEPLGARAHGLKFDARRGREGRAQLFGQAGGWVWANIGGPHAFRYSAAHLWLLYSPTGETAD